MRTSLRTSAQTSSRRSLPTFRQRFADRADRFSPFCLGIDPTPELLSAWEVPDHPQGLRDFCDRIGAWLAEGDVALVKPQSACFERFGAAGALILEQFIEDLRAADILVILDVKRGDIAATNKSYAQAFFGVQSPMRVDAMTAHPFLGFADLKPLLDEAQDQGGMVFIVAASSNPDGVKFQSAKLASGESLTESLAAQIAAHESAGAVVGATRDDLTPELLSVFGDSLLLVPGIGAQGADFSALDRFLDNKALIPTASRAVFGAGPDEKSFRDSLKRHQEAALRIYHR